MVKNLSETCQKCASGLYALSYNWGKCEQCPVGGECSNGILGIKNGFFCKCLIYCYIKKGYWRMNNNTNYIYECKPSSGSCM